MLVGTVCRLSCQYSLFLSHDNQLGRWKSSVYPIHCLTPVSDHSTSLEASPWNHHQVGPAKQTAQGQQHCVCGKKDRPAIPPFSHNTTPILHIAQCNHSYSYCIEIASCQVISIMVQEHVRLPPYIPYMQI